MGHNRVPAVNYDRIVPALVEHARVHPQNAGEIDGPVQSPFVRADHNKVILVNDQILLGIQQRLDELVGGREVVEAV